jgi:hypothetical protein
MVENSTITFLRSVTARTARHIVPQNAYSTRSPRTSYNKTRCGEIGRSGSVNPQRIALSCPPWRPRTAIFAREGGGVTRPQNARPGAGRQLSAGEPNAQGGQSVKPVYISRSRRGMASRGWLRADVHLSGPLSPIAARGRFCATAGLKRLATLPWSGG